MLLMLSRYRNVRQCFTIVHTDAHLAEAGLLLGYLAFICKSCLGGAEHRCTGRFFSEALENERIVASYAGFVLCSSLPSINLVFFGHPMKLWRVV